MLIMARMRPPALRVALWVLLWCLVEIPNSLAQTNRTAVFQSKGLGSKSPGIVLDTLIGASPLQCGMTCSISETCGGFNRRSDSCQLIQGVTDTSQILSESGHTYFKRLGFDPTDECVSSPCNNGTCVDSGSSFRCVCDNGYYGQYCQIDCRDNYTCCAINHVISDVITLIVPFPGQSDRNIQIPVESGYHGDKWMVLMRRKDGSVNFTRVWSDYKQGFGDINGEFWIGNEVMHHLTNNGSTWLLRIDMQDYLGNCRHALYTTFRVATEATKYMLRIGGYSGTAGDGLNTPDDDPNVVAFKNHDNRTFITYEQGKYWECAPSLRCGWWFTNCFYAKLTGLYGQHVGNQIGISWEAWLPSQFLKYADMKIKVV